MERPRIEFVSPTSDSFQGMKGVLFRPFDIGKWFVLGFSAWLAGLMDGGGSSGGNWTDTGTSSASPDDVFREVGQWIEDNIEVVIIAGSLLLLFIIALLVVLTWVSSRGKFMFLDNVVHNRCLVKDPWTRFRALGNSLFRWRLVFGLIVLAVVLLIGGTTVGAFAGLGGGDEIIIPGLVGGGLALFAALVVAGYIGVLLEDFVIPVMYRDGLFATEAWKRFLALHATAVGSFVLYALWRLLLSLGVGIAVLVLGLATCCIGFIIMAIPYLGTVLLLPVQVFFRFLGPAFLRQFGADYDILGARVEPPGPVVG